MSESTGDNNEVTVNLNGSELEEQSGSNPPQPSSRPMKLEIDEALLDVDESEAFPSPSSSLLPPPGMMDNNDPDEVQITGAPRARQFKARTPLTVRDLKKEAIIGRRDLEEEQKRRKSTEQTRA